MSIIILKTNFFSLRGNILGMLGVLVTGHPIAMACYKPTLNMGCNFAGDLFAQTPLKTIPLSAQNDQVLDGKVLVVNTT